MFAQLRLSLFTGPDSRQKAKYHELERRKVEGYRCPGSRQSMLCKAIILLQALKERIFDRPGLPPREFLQFCVRSTPLRDSFIKIKEVFVVVFCVYGWNEWMNEMENFNRRSSHGYHGSKLRVLAQHAHSRGTHAFIHTLTSTKLHARCAKRQLSCYWHNL